ncbi:MAG: ribokinase [Lachnospiraceae bacterium]|nr:ribokinase [Lachnospiraceae bacterium]
MKKIIIVGSLNTDISISAPYCPKEGETLTGSDFMVSFGGKGANQAVAASRLGGHVLMCGCVGADEFGKSLLANLQESGTDVRHVREIADSQTGTAVILLTGGENRIILEKGANAKLSKEDVDAVLLEAEEGDLYLTQLENPVEVIGYGLKQAKEKGLVTILNPAPANQEITKYFQYVDMIMPNENELQLLGGKQLLFEKGIKKAITTLGSNGYEYSDEKITKRFPCISVNVVDTTGAGDTFCGSLAGELARGSSLEKAMAFASKAASLACTHKGAADSIPSRNEVEAWREEW